MSGEDLYKYLRHQSIQCCVVDPAFVDNATMYEVMDQLTHRIWDAGVGQVRHLVGGQARAETDKRPGA
jgi:hypothetical protein